MQEFRPTDVIEQDTRLAASLAEGDLDALDALVGRYGRAVHAVAGAHRTGDGDDQTAAVFAQVWHGRSSRRPESDFAPWIGELAATAADRTPADVERTWSLAMAIDAVDAEVRPALRAHHLDASELAEGADRQELRLRRRLAHLGDDDAVAAALGDPVPWSDPPEDLMEQVRARVASEAGAEAAAGPLGSDVDQPVGRSDGGWVERSSTEFSPDERSSRVTRSLRPVLLGLAGAAAVLFVAIVALSAASGSPQPVAFTADLIPTGAIVEVEGGELSVTETDGGLRLDLDVPTLPRRAGNQFYEGVMVLLDGTEVSVGTFNEGFDISLSGGVALDRVESFDVVARDLGNDRAQVVLKLDVPRD